MSSDFKVVITGHTSGIGKELYDLCVKTGYLTIGLSRSTGFDVNVDYLCEDHLDAYAIINNAYTDDNAQSKQLLELYEHKFKGHVINIGSVSSERVDATKYGQIIYSANKKHLENVHNHVRRNGLSSTLLILGMCNTKYNINKDAPKLDPKDVANQIWTLIGNRQIAKIELTEPHIMETE